MTAVPRPSPPAASGGHRGGDETIRRRCRSLLQSWPVPHSLDRYDTTLGPSVVLSAGKHLGRPPVVVLPGGGLSAATIRTAVEHLARTRRVFAADLPGEPGLNNILRPPRSRSRARARAACALSESCQQDRDPETAPSGEDIHDIVLAAVDQHEPHGDRVETQQPP